MKKITLSADENLIQRARQVAHAQHKTLNAAFREWLEHYSAPPGSAQAVESLYKRLRHIRAIRPYTRNEMNER